MLFEKLANWPGFLFLLALLVLCFLGFQWRSKRFNLDSEHKLPEARLWYSPADVWNFLEYINSELGRKGLEIYALTLVTLDFIFPIAYGTFFAILITLLFSEEVKQNLIIIPLLATVFDLGENFILACLTLKYPCDKPYFARIAGVFTSLKWFMTISSVLLTLGGAIHRYVL
jgi:hypothetical protein